MYGHHTIALALCATLTSLSPNSHAGQSWVAFLSSSDAALYTAARSAASRHLSADDSMRLTATTLPSPEDLRAEALSLQAQGVSAILTLGAAATHAAAVVTDVPIVACLVADESAMGPSNVTGVTLAIPIDVQLQLIHTLLPNYRRIGVVWGAPANKEAIARATRVAARLGLALEVRNVDHPREVPTAIESLRSSADLIWGLADGVVLTPQTARHLLVFADRNRIPLVGPSGNWARAGALAAFDLDYADLGLQCGELVREVVATGRAVDVTPRGPRVVGYALNRSQAEHVRVGWSDAVFRGATEVFTVGRP